MRMESPLNQRLRWSPPDVVYTPIDVTSRQEIEQLKRENSELKQLVGELSLELHRFKKTALPPLHDNGTGA